MHEPSPPLTDGETLRLAITGVNHRRAYCLSISLPCRQTATPDLNRKTTVPGDAAIWTGQGWHTGAVVEPACAPLDRNRARIRSVHVSGLIYNKCVTMKPDRSRPCVTALSLVRYRSSSRANWKKVTQDCWRESVGLPGTVNRKWCAATTQNGRPGGPVRSSGLCRIHLDRRYLRPDNTGLPE